MRGREGQRESVQERKHMREKEERVRKENIERGRQAESERDTDRQTDGRMDRQMNGQTDRQIETLSIHCLCVKRKLTEFFCKTHRVRPETQ